MVGIGVALWAGTGVALALENALDHIWGVPIRRRANSALARLRALVWIAVLGGVTLIGTRARLGERVRAPTARPCASPALRRLARASTSTVFLAVFRVLTSHTPVVARRAARARSWPRSRGRCCSSAGGYIVDHQLRHASSTYGVFAIVIGLLSWLYLAANVTLLSAEINVVARAGSGRGASR